MTASVPDSARELRQRAGIATAAPAATSGGSNVSDQRSSMPEMREPEYVAPMVVYLATDDAWNVNGKIFAASGGSVTLLHDEVPMRTMTKPDGAWTIDELRELVPLRLMYGLPNPAPPPRDLAIPGRPVS
jgi:hypothetical protein